ncbi:MAG: alpha/beta hydrolase family protein [Gemmataceae bacterium]
MDYRLSPSVEPRPSDKFLVWFGLKHGGEAPRHLRGSFNPMPRQQRQFHEIDRHNQRLLENAHNVRRDWMPIADQLGRPDDKKKLDTSSLAAYEKSVERYRDFFANEVIGRFDHKPLPMNPRTRLHSESDKWTIYQVALDVFPDVFAYGLLVIPKGLKPGERRPVVVCQHGLEGRPEDCIGEKQGYAYYKAFATRLAERGFVTFAPQNLYIGKDKFRTLQRKANPLGKTLFSVIVPQHQQITDWLKTLPFVDGERIGFYGLSYGGKTAMRVPALVKNYCLSICSADFNDWVWKNASTRDRYSYVWTGEYEIFEFDLGSTFNYAEMAALIAPRPFMVERGHFDGVAPDERVALEFAKVRHLYQAKLGIGDRAEIEWFVGPHTINGKGTFAFLHKHLKWPAPGGQ